MAFKKQFADDEELNPPQETSMNDFEQLLNESFEKRQKRLSVGDKLKCEVLSVGKEQVIVSTGGRYDGFVPAQLLQDGSGASKVKVGDVIELFVTYVKGSEVFLSPIRGGGQALAAGIQEAFDNNLPIEGRVEAVNKGGFQVNILGKQAFCPLSQMDSRRIEKPEDYVGKKFEFKITQVTEGGRNVVVSRRKLLDDNQGAMLANFKDQRSPGDIVSGKVTRLEPFGAFIEIAPGVEGLAHISELAWTRVSSPKDVLEPGQVVSAKILKIEHSDNGRLKISLTLKQSENDPWQNLPSQVQTGRVVSGKVTRLMPFGAFVEIASGIEGLVPLSEMSSTKKVSQASEVVQEGEQISVMIKDINPQAKRISLSIKDALSEAASASEAQDIKDFEAIQAARLKSSGAGGIMAAKMQAALDKKNKR